MFRSLMNSLIAIRFIDRTNMAFLFSHSWDRTWAIMNIWIQLIYFLTFLHLRTEILLLLLLANIILNWAIIKRRLNSIRWCRWRYQLWRTSTPLRWNFWRKIFHILIESNCRNWMRQIMLWFRLLVFV